MKLLLILLYMINIGTAYAVKPFIIRRYIPSGKHENITHVIYENAYPDADLIYYIDYGKAPRLAKLIQFHSEPTELDYSLLLQIYRPHEAEFANNELAIKTDKG